MRRPLLRPTATATALLLAATALAGCSGGSGSPDASASKGGGATASATPTGPAPVVADEAALRTVTTSYTTRNNAAVRRAGHAPWRASVWRGVDAGPLLPIDDFATTADRVQKRDEHGREFLYEKVQGYVPVAAGRTRTVVVSADLVSAAPRQRAKSRRTAAKSPWRSLVVLSDAGAGWRAVADLSVRRALLPAPTAYGADATPAAAEVARAEKLAAGLPAYWETGRAPTGFADTRWIDGPRTDHDRSLRQGFGRADIRVHRFGPDSVHVVRTSTGLLVVASYKARTTYAWSTPNGFVFWTKDDAAVRGGGHHATITDTRVLTAAFVVPRTGGKARGIGLANASALF